MKIPTQLPISDSLLTKQIGQARGTETPTTSFGDVLTDLVGDVEQSQQQIDVEVERLLTGDASNMHDVSLAVAKADLSFRFMMEVRDKLISAYREIMRMQV